MAREGTPRLRHLRHRRLGRIDHQPIITDFLDERATTLAGTGTEVAFTAANATGILTSATHGLKTGDGPFILANSGGALPAGLDAASYWVIVLDANTFKLALSRLDALAGSAVSFTDDGTGTQSFAPAADAPEDIWDRLKQGTKPETIATATDADNL